MNCARVIDRSKFIFLFLISLVKEAIHMRIPQDGMSNSPYGPHAKNAYSYSVPPLTSQARNATLYFFFFLNFIIFLYFRILEVRVRFDPYTGKAVSPPPNPEGILFPFTCRTSVSSSSSSLLPLFCLFLLLFLTSWLCLLFMHMIFFNRWSEFQCFWATTIRRPFLSLPSAVSLSFPCFYIFELPSQVRASLFLLSRGGRLQCRGLLSSSTIIYYTISLTL